MSEWIVLKLFGQILYTNDLICYKNITIKEMWEKKRKDQIRTEDVTEFGLKMPTSPGLSTSNNWDWSETLKNSFTLIELGPLHKNGLSNLSVTKVTTH
jgi:hypothetical protein